MVRNVIWSGLLIALLSFSAGYIPVLHVQGLDPGLARNVCAFALMLSIVFILVEFKVPDVLIDVLIIAAAGVCWYLKSTSFASLMPSWTADASVLTAVGILFAVFAIKDLLVYRK
ncbi:MAG: hypothetical protein JWM46_599 [Candidatus Kaiserbacteria bacterium]|nr:hypothetical protein [Candidatus Kaiserbacteria bacterium]